MSLGRKRHIVRAASTVWVLAILGAMGPGVRAASGKAAEAHKIVRAAAARMTCRPMAAETLQAASRRPCVAIPFAGDWSVDLRGRVLTEATGVSAAILPKAVVWLATRNSLVPEGRSPGFTLYLTPNRTGGGNVAIGSRTMATLPAAVRSATIEDAGDGVVVIESRLTNGDQAIWAVSYEHPGAVRELVRVPGELSFGPMAVRRHTIALWAYPGNPATTSRVILYVAHVTHGVSSPVRIYRGRAGETSGWFLDGLRVQGKGIPGTAPLPMPRIPGFAWIRLSQGPTALPVIEAPRGWTVKQLPGGSSIGVQATDPQDPAIQVTLWRNGCFGCYLGNGLGLVQGPDEPIAGLPSRQPIDWIGDHTIRYANPFHVKGRAFVRTVLVTVPPGGGTDQVTVTAPAGDARLTDRILSAFRWS